MTPATRPPTTRPIAGHTATTPSPAERAALDARALDELRAAVAGEVLDPHAADPDGLAAFEAARRGWNPHAVHHPVVIVVAADADDVAHALRFARGERLAVTVQSTGHGVARPAAGGVLVVTSRLDTIDIDQATRTARVGAGVTWGPLLRAARAHGLTGLAGSCDSVGVVGYTLGGGLGWLARRYGLASDAVLAVELVTPDGLAVTASADRHPELFWALKGGGAGLLGVVTAMEIELVPVPSVYAGNLVYPVADAPAVMRRWRDWVGGVRPEMTSQVVITSSTVSVRGCWAGDPVAGRHLLDAWRQWRTPLQDDWVMRGSDELEAISTDGGPEPIGITNEWLKVVRDEIVEILVDVAGERGGVAWAGIRHAGGAVRARAEAAVNGAGRADPFLLELCGGTPAARTAARDRLQPFVTGATFLNLVDGDERRERTTTSFRSDHLARLRAVKHTLDPHDRFRHGLAVTPDPA